MSKQKLLFDIKSRVDLIDKELVDGYGIKAQREMIIEEVIDSNLSIITNTKVIRNYNDFYYLQKALQEIYNTIKVIKDEIELEEFYKSGKVFDIVKLKKEYELMNLKKRFPKFDIDKYLELLVDPILEFKNFRGERIRFNEFWVKKNMIAINQMIFNEMDLYILNIGKEGSGKSCWSSQQILYFYKFLTLVGLIDYVFDIKRMFFADILSFLDENNNQDRNEFFRIVCLDEGNELNRSNFREEANQEFKFSMRTERKMIRIIIINMQQIGELDTSISLSRVNFIYNCKMRSNNKTGTLNKGFIDMYIIPRGDNIYSEKNKEVLSRVDILNSFATKLDKKKDYYVSLPRKMIINSFRFKNIWGFDKDKYDDHVKDEIGRRKFQKKLNLTNTQAYILKTKLREFTKLGTFDVGNNPNDKKMYDILNNLFIKIEKYFELNPEKELSIKNHYAKIYK